MLQTIYITFLTYLQPIDSLCKLNGFKMKHTILLNWVKTFIKLFEDFKTTWNDSGFYFSVKGILLENTCLKVPISSQENVHGRYSAVSIGVFEQAL